MDVSTVQNRLSDAPVVVAEDRTQEIAEQERLQELEMRQQEDVAAASRAPEQAAGKIVDEIV